MSFKKVKKKFFSQYNTVKKIFSKKKKKLKLFKTKVVVIA